MTECVGWCSIPDQCEMAGGCIEGERERLEREAHDRELRNDDSLRNGGEDGTVR
jgi:hypothetical protein